MAKTEIAYWEDRIGSSMKSKSVEVTPYFYEVGPKGAWQMLIAAEDQTVKANMVANIKVERVRIPRESIIFPCFCMRHALGVVLAVTSPGIPKRVEEERTIEEVIFMGVVEGRVCKGELLGVLNVMYARPTYSFAKEAAIRWLEERSIH